MASIDMQARNNSNRYSGITLTLPNQYRPSYRVPDPLLQSSSEQMPLNSLALQGSTAMETSGAASFEPLSTQTAPRTVQLGSSFMSSSSATVSHPQNPSLPLSCTPSGNYRTVPRQRGWRGGRRGDWRGGPTHGPYSWRNDIYVGRVSLPPASDLMSFSPWNIDPDLKSPYLAALKSSTDFFIPKIIHNPPVKAFNLGEQSETCTTWRGLSSMGAEELLTWTNIYHMVSRQRSKDPACPVNLSSVAVEMVKLYEQGPPTGFKWFFSAPNIYQRVERFLSISIGTPILQTEEHEVPVVGEKYTLSPNVRRCAQGLDHCLTGEIVYSASESWLTFDESSNVFTGIVPFVPPRNIIVKANFIEFLDERVHLEHTIRVKVHLRARGARYPDDYINEVFMGPLVDHKSDQEITKPRKQVSFADEHDADSLHSSPDHLRSFFNELSAMTCTRVLQKNSQQAAYAGQIPEAVCSGSDHFRIPNPFPEAHAGGIMSEESSTSFESQGASAEATSSPQPERLANANASVSPDVSHPCTEQGEPVHEKVVSSSARGVISGKSQSTGRHLQSRDSYCATYCTNSENLEKPVFFYDTDTDIDLDVALGISCPGDGGSEEVPEPASAKPLVFRNRFNTLSTCSNMDLPTQACNLDTDIESVSQPEDQQIMDDMAFESTLSTTVFQSPKDVRQLEGFPDSLYQWNWRGWEKEMGITRSPRNKSSVPGPYRDDAASDAAIILTEADIGNSGTTEKAPIGSYEEAIKNEGAPPSHESLMGYGGLLSPTLSSTTTDRARRHSSKGSWSMEDDACVLTNATNCVDKKGTLYETVRNQFYKDHRIRQMSSIQNSNSSTTRGTLSSVFSSSSEHPEITHAKQHHIRDKMACYQSEKAREEEPSFSFPVDEPHVSSSSLVSVDQREPDIGSIAAAVKNSLAAEVQGQDAREKAEIRKGILHHQVMDLQRSERHRDFSSSNYDDIFWSSDGASVDENLDKGIA